MTANANVVDLVKGNSTLVRPKFSPGLLLRDDDLNVGVDYTRELSRLLFQSLFGCGVVCGLTVTTSVQCGKLLVTVDPGVALNGAGDPIHVPEKTTLTVDPTCGKTIPGTLWVLLCRTEKCCAPRSAVCGCEEDDSASVCTREQEWFEIRLVTDPGECTCKCDQKTVDPSKLKKASEKAAAQPAAAARTAEIRSAASAPPEPGCACVDPCDPCYRDHYAGKCSCDCCNGDCVVLALLTAADKRGRQAVDNGGIIAPTVNHSVRRFIRPVLMRDPVVWLEQNPGQKLCRDANTKLTVRKNK